MRVLAVLLIAVTAAACVKSETRFERVEEGHAVLLPLALDGVEGLRDGDSVKATIQFGSGADSASLTIAVHLGPPPVFSSGTYRASIGGRMSAGAVGCESLSYLGGQAATPSVGGVFVLKGPDNVTLYRVKMPPTPIRRRVAL